MLFNSIHFLIFYPVVLLVYFLLPSIKTRNILLLIASYYFYSLYKIGYDKYKHINFVLTFPPKSILWFRLLDEKELLNNKEHAQLYLLKRIEKLENVTVYNFQNVYQITENPDIYHDVSHYNKSGNDFMLDSIKDKTHQTNSVKYEKQMKDLRNHIYSDKVENMLK